MQRLEKYDVNWCRRRMPKIILDIMEENPGKVFVAGGFIRSCIANEFINDIDVFTTSKEKAELFARRISKKGKRLIETDNAFTVLGYKYPIQLIHRWTFDLIEECLKSFDFTVACAALYFDSKELIGVCLESFYQDLAGKRLVYTSPQRNEDAGGSMIRVLKFYQKGYRITLDSLGAVIARLIGGVENIETNGEEFNAQIIYGMLREVDPQTDPSYYIENE